MNILLVAATPLETRLIRQTFGFSIEGQGWASIFSGQHQISLLHTGIGMVNTAFQLGQYLAIHKPDRAVNFGIAGSFDRDLKLGTVVEVIEDCYAELGAEDDAQFLDLEQMGFAAFSWQGKAVYNRLVNPHQFPLDCPQVKGITVNRVHGRQSSIDEVEELWEPQIESMEGAAFFQAMMQENIPFFAIRGLSNYVEIRNKRNWNIPLAVENVQNKLIKWILDHGFYQTSNPVSDPQNPK